MIDKQDVIAFFDRCAPTWDAELIRDDGVINTILDRGGVTAGTEVLDVACGTGVLFSYYLARNVRSVTGIDISPKMAEIAAAKWDDPRISVICGDVEEARFDHRFDAVVVYNAFPHFPDPNRLIQALAALTKTGGRLTIAHGMSRRRIDSHHKGGARHVSNGLMHEEDLKLLLTPYFDVDVVISDESMYQVSGVKRSR